MAILKKIKGAGMKLPIKKLLLICKKQKKLYIAVALVVGTLCLFTSDTYSPDFYFISSFPVNNVSCHYAKDDDVLLSAEGIWFTPAARSIFFHETSCRGDLTVRQLCSVESAARSHPLWQIHVLFSGPVNKTTLLSGNMATLNALTNVNFARVHLLAYANGTPVEALVFGGALNRTRWRYSHTGDVLRYLTLYKWGGIYLDLDAIVIKPLTSLARNWAARESNFIVASGALSFRRDRIGRMLATNALGNLRENYRGDKWGQNGPLTITRVLKKLCQTTVTSQMSSVTCQGFEVYHQRFFYPITSDDSNLYFKKGNISEPQAYIHHLYNSVTKNLKVENGSPYQELASEYCPTTYNAFKVEFGS